MRSRSRSRIASGLRWPQTRLRNSSSVLLCATMKSVQARNADSTVAPSSTSSQRCCTSPACGLQTSSTRTVEAFRPLHEAVDEGVGDAVEHRTDHRLQRAAAEGVVQLEGDLARGLVAAGLA